MTTAAAKAVGLATVMVSAAVLAVEYKTVVVGGGCLLQNSRKPSSDVGGTITLTAAILASAVEGTSAVCL